MSKKDSLANASKAALGKLGFVPHTRELLGSKAWQTASIHLRRVLDRLELEHLMHAGKENGSLIVTFDQFAKAGATRRYINATLQEGEARGLLEVTHRGRPGGGGLRNPSKYRVTYLPFRFVPGIGPPVYCDPTNEWLAYDPAKDRPERKKRDPPAFVRTAVTKTTMRRGT